MPATLSSLTKNQKETLSFGLGAVILIGLTAGLLYDLSQRRFESAVALAQVEQQEVQARNAQPATESDLAQWADVESQFAGLLIADQDVPRFFEEITSIGAKYRLQPGISTDEKTINPNNSPTPDELKLLGLGVRRYMVMTVTFKGDYPDTARFFSEIAGLPRPVEFKKINMRRSPPLVDVTMIMHVYKREGV